MDSLLKQATQSVPFIVGLTGGIGSGKSTAATIFARLGITVIDTDKIAHQLTGLHGAALPAISAQFGSQALTPDGALNRPYMREQVFSDNVKRQQLESILHPMIYQESLRQLSASLSPYTILVVPLLFETGDYLPLISRSIVVDCSETKQIARVRTRNQLAPETINAIMSTQLSRQERCAQADDIINNDGDLAQVTREVGQLHLSYLSMNNHII